MHSHFLPIHHCGVLRDELPSTLVLAVLVRASRWFSVLELLLEVLYILVTLHALKVTHDEFRLSVGGSSHSSVNRHESTERKSSQVSDLGHLWQIVNSNLIVALLDGIHVVLSTLHKSSESSSKTRLELVEVCNDCCHELSVMMLEASKMGEVDIHGNFFLLPHSLCSFHVVLDWLTFLVRKTICILTIVGVLWVEFETTKLSL